MKFSFFLIFLCFSIPGLAIDISCTCEDLPIYFSVTSKNGINLRVEPSTESQILFKASFDEILEVCRPQLSYGKIDSLDGHWVKVCYKGREAFAFNKYLKLSPKNVDFIVTGKVKSYGVDISKTYYALYDKNQKDLPRFDLRKSKIKMDSTRNIILSDENVEPIFLIHGEKIVERSNIIGKYIGRMILPGETITMSFGANEFYVYAEATIVKSPNTSGRVFSGIKDYKLMVRSVINGHAEDNAIITNDYFYSWDSVSYEGGINLLWVGDLDGDNLLDILVTSSNHFACFKYHLFLSNKDEKKFLKEVAREDFCGC